MSDEVIEVLIDHVLTPVDKDDWEADPKAVTELVRKNRLALRLDENDTAEEAAKLLEQAEASS